MPKLGDKIRLNLCLFDGATNKYVRAYVRDASGSELAGSPVSLTHTGNGLYQSSALSMPNTKQVTAVYKVFNDAGFITPSPDHADALDTFDLEPLVYLSSAELQGIAGNTSLTGEGAEITFTTGEAPSLTLTAKVSGAPFDISTATSIVTKFPGTGAGDEVIVTDYTITNGVQGEYSVSLTAAQTKKIAVKSRQTFVSVVRKDGKDHYFYFSEKLNVRSGRLG